MKKLLLILTFSLLIFSTVLVDSAEESILVETKEEKRAKYVLINMQQDYIACYSFYKIGSEYVRNSNGDEKVINGIENSSDISLKLAYETGEIIGMSSDEMSLKVKSEMKKQLNLIDNNFSNSSILLEKYAQTCKNLIENKKQRISFWEDQAANKFK